MTDAAPATVPVVRESTEPGAISAEPPSGRETDPDDDAAHGAPPIRAAMPVVRVHGSQCSLFFSSYIS